MAVTERIVPGDLIMLMPVKVKHRTFRRVSIVWEEWSINDPARVGTYNTGSIVMVLARQNIFLYVVGGGQLGWVMNEDNWERINRIVNPD